MFDGLQIQWLLDPDGVDMVAVFEDFLRRLRPQITAPSREGELPALLPSRELRGDRSRFPVGIPPGSRRGTTAERPGDRHTFPSVML